MSDEFERIAKLRARFGQWSAPQVLVGIGDDAAVLHRPGGNVVLSVDTAVEGVHFTRALASLPQIAARAFTAAISDLAAMGARPEAALSALIVPAEIPLADFDALIQGIAEAAADYGCPVVGGNLSSGGELSLTTTVIGAQEGAGMLRSGARPGDGIYVTGTLGDAALGLALLQRGAEARGPEFVARWRAPRARIAEGLQLAGHASAAIDVSDGALQDLGHVCAASALGAEIYADRVPLRPGFAQLAAALGQDPLSLALFGGEDYELIYTLPESAQNHAIGTCMGRMLASSNSVRVLDEKGGILPLEGHGYRHFEG
jgi:thiamine-monophosphate kinase